MWWFDLLRRRFLRETSPQSAWTTGSCQTEGRERRRRSTCQTQVVPGHVGLQPHVGERHRVFSDPDGGGTHTAVGGVDRRPDLNGVIRQNDHAWKTCTLNYLKMPDGRALVQKPHLLLKGG